MRAVLLYALIAGLAAAQNPPPASLAVLEQAALKATTEWQLLARDLETRVARMLPCDPKTRAAIEDVSRASQNRLAALTQYYRAAQSLAENRAEGAKRLLASEEARDADVTWDKIHSDQTLTAVKAAIADLAQSAKVKPSLAPAQAALLQTAEMVKQRFQLAQEQSDRREAVLESLRALVAAYQAREGAMKEASSAFDVERGKWNAYYAARMQRSQTECALTGGQSAAPAAPKPAARPNAGQGKQK